MAIGRLTAPHGIKGEMRLFPLTDFPERFRPGLSVFLEFPPESRQGSWVQIKSVRRQRGGLLVVGLEGITTRDQAEALRSALLRIGREDRHPLPADTFYVDDLIGLPVFTADGQQVGEVSQVHNNPGNDLLVVTADQRHCLVPMVRQFVAVDLDQGRLTVFPIPGLLDELTEGRAP